MNPADESHEPTKIDEYRDRLIDRGLVELLGNENPPNLSACILAADSSARPRLRQDSSPGRDPRRFKWVSFTVAAALVIGLTTIFLIPRTSELRRARIMAMNENETRFTADLGSAQTSVPSIKQEQAPITSYVQAIDESLEGTLQVNSPHPTAVGDVRRGALVRAPMNGKELSKQLRQSQSSRNSTHDRLANSPTAGATGFATEVPFHSPTDEHLRSIQSGSADGVDRYAGYGGYGGESGGYGRGGYGVNGRAWQENTAEGSGPALPGDQYTRIVENPFIKAEGAHAVSTFSIDVDTASYANIRQFLLEMSTLPPPDAVRIEELINYFEYDYAGPPTDGGNEDGSAPFATHLEVASCPWNTEHRLVRIGVKGREMARDRRPPSNLVFLVDVSGSMDEPNKLPLVVYGLQQLTRELGATDRVAIVVYASSEGLVLPSTPGSNQPAILAALGQLQAGGSTAGGAGIQLAYQIAEDHFIEGGTNRVILCTDGDFNVGVTSTAELQRLCEQKAKDTGVFLSVLGFGRGNLNDAMMEAISNHGNGNYHYVDNRTEARRVLVEEMTGTLVTIAKDVKIQVEFNPRQVAGYRLIGYENRMLRTEDFNDDTKDAGEIGAGHTVTALYEIVPAGKAVDVAPVDELKYQQPASIAARSESQGHDNAADFTAELLTVKMRFKEPDGDTSHKFEWPLVDKGNAFGAASGDFQFASAVAGFGLLLRDSQYKGNLTYAAVLELAQSAIGRDENGYRAEFVEMVRRAKSLRGE
jgi:Ca-activated chloride channel family protein